MVGGCRYKSLRSCFDQATDARTYRAALAGLHHDEQICVPFSWIRTQISDMFPMEGHSSMTLLGGASSLGAHAGLTQLWKDMMRDKVRGGGTDGAPSRQTHFYCRYRITACLPLVTCLSMLRACLLRCASTAR